MIEREITVTTPEGELPTFLFHPDDGGPHPVVLYLMDAPGIRPALREMASRLAASGYYVMLPYLYYRGGPFQELGMSDEDAHRRLELMAQITPTNIVTDADALLAAAAEDPAAGDGPVGVIGFCMSGGMAISVARAMPDRVTAAASIHGAWLVRDTDDSPHLGLDAVEAEIHLAWCDPDPTAPAEQREALVAALEEAGITYTLDLETEAQHGFAPAGPRHHPEASERHWDRVHDLLDRNL